MKNSLRTMLFASALIPVAAFAQDAQTTTPDQQTPPVVVQPNGEQPAAGEAAPADDMLQEGTTAEGTAEMTPDGTAAPDSTAQTDPNAVDPNAQPTDQATDQAAPQVQQPDATAEGTPVQPDASTTVVTTTTETPQTGEMFVTVPPTGAWRVADLTGKDVYGVDNEDIGEIKDVIVSQDGQVTAVIVGVGGFLGIGEKDVAVSISALQFGPGMTPEEAAAKSGATASTDMAAAPAPAPTGEPQETGDIAANVEAEAPAVEIGEDALPNRIVLNATRQQLEDAPAFEGIRSANADQAVPMTDQPMAEPVQPAPAQ